METKESKTLYVAFVLALLLAWAFLSIIFVWKERSAGAAVEWKQVDAEVSVIQVLPGDRGYKVQEWYAVARVIVDGKSVSVRLPDDAVVVVGDVIDVWVNPQSGEIQAENPSR